MVLRGEMTTTATRPEQRSKSLHNFTLPNLKWGSQRHLKCMKIDGGDGGSGDHRLRRRSPPTKLTGFKFGDSDNHRSMNQLRNAPFKSVVEIESEEGGIEEFREKIMSDLKSVRDKITQSMFRKHDFDGGEEEERRREAEKEIEISPAKPWNLRKRRAACKEPVNGLNQINTGFVGVEERLVNPVKERGGLVEAETAAKEIREKFTAKLSKKEIEEDFMAVLGVRPPRRPKKRPRTVQRKLDNMYPGLYLSEVTLDAYKVREETKKRRISRDDE